MGTKIIKSLIIVIVSYFLMSAPLSFAESMPEFQYNSTVDISNHQDDFILLEILPNVYDSMDESLKDIRIYSASQTIKYLVLPVKEITNTYEDINLEFYNAGIIDDQYVFEVKIPKALQTDGIRYHIKLNSNAYLIETDIYGSNDRETWQYLKEQTIYQIDGRSNWFTLDHIEYDYIKVAYAITDNKDLSNVISVSYYQSAQTNDSDKIIVPEFTVSNDNDEKVTSFDIDMGYNNYPTSQITIESSETFFYRDVTVSGSNNSETWRTISNTVIFRDSSAEKLTITYSPEHYRYLKLNISDKDNPSLQIDGITVTVVPVYLLTDISDIDTSTITAYWGNNTLETPDYDISMLNISLDPDDYVIYEVSTYEINKNFKIPGPLTERLPWLMPVGLGLLILGALLYLYKSMKHVE